MKLILWSDMVIAKGLSFDKADRLLEQANKSKAVKYLTFGMVLRRKTWTLFARPRNVIKAFCKNPEHFVLEI